MIEWRDVAGYDGVYQVSNMGGLRRVWKTGPKNLTLSSHVSGYIVISLNYLGIRKTTTMHLLVAEAFIPKGTGYLALHRNGVRDDNRVENLYWGTHRDNNLDMVSDGTHNMARKTRCKHGHEYTPANTMKQKGGRFCRECNRLKCIAYRKEKI